MPPTKSSKSSKRTTAAASTISGPWSTGRILNSTSPAATKDLHALLVQCISDWHSNYTEAEKRAIIDKLPPRFRTYDVDETTGSLLCPISADFALEDPYLKAAVPRFKQHVNEGYYEQGWQNKARKAMQERREGKFDTYLQEQMEAAFGDGEDVGDNGPVVEEGGLSSDGEWPVGKGKGRR
ncbi:hypothetical protein H2202_000448 [Exophiala xenobiotica]|nr:hypothetical protein H2202_000448 [Exophiala xenobiotica]KAK5247981.1 hypothetical protein LTS06_006970 [Exophiala xenobiotica]KAK5297519.1 hypothetical protein LTR14_003250 [Exophiala xenobiotica]KAK5328740.1 hypothetical protein LTR93_002525 [Exophiala xenobiotica]KAK5356732.1 hypothetical protein LTR61_000467 [Exophiala xenobiotica]